MTIPDCSCGSCRCLLVVTELVQHHTWSEEGYDVASYLVGYEGSGHAYALHLHYLRFIHSEVDCWHEVDMRIIFFIYMRSVVSFNRGSGLFIVYNGLHFLMKIILD